jgi:hypothetical protein
MSGYNGEGCESAIEKVLRLLHLKTMKHKTCLRLTFHADRCPTCGKTGKEIVDADKPCHFTNNTEENV